MERLADRQLDELVDDGPVRVHHATTPRRSRCWWSPTWRASPRPTTACSPTGSTKLPEDMEHKPLEFLYEQFTAYIEDRRREPARRHHDGDGHGHLPRRDDARGERRRAARRQPVLRRPGDHGPAAVVRAADPRRAAGHPGPAAERSRPHPELRRGDAAVREPAARPVPHGQGDDDGRRCRRSRPGARCCSCPERPTATRACSRTRPSSTSTARTPATTWPSATASTTAPAPTSPGRRAGSRSTGSSTAPRTSRSPRTRTARPTPAATSTSRPTSSAASRASSSSSPRRAGRLSPPRAARRPAAA